MKLYLSSYRIPTPNDLVRLIGKPLEEVSVALIPNAKDYYSEHARTSKVDDLVRYMNHLGLKVDAVDLRLFDFADTLKNKLGAYDLMWVMGGNTFVLRYEMRRSGFEKIIKGLLEAGVVYGGDSAGALTAGVSIAGVEMADEPEFAEAVIKEGLSLVPFAVLPHVDNPEFTEVLPVFRKLHQDKEVVELKDSQAVICDGKKHWIVEAPRLVQPKESQSQLSARLKKAAKHVTVGARYMHYKQHSYKVLNLAIREEDNESCVVYQAEYGDCITFTRRVTSWIEEVEIDGKKVPRFAKIENA